MRNVNFFFVSKQEKRKSTVLVVRRRENVIVISMAFGETTLVLINSKHYQQSCGKWRAEVEKETTRL